MRKLIAPVFIHLMIACASVSQVYPQLQDNCEEVKLRGKSYVKVQDYPGNQEIFSTWCKGKIILTNDQEIHSLLLNINGFTGELIYYNSANKTAVAIDHEMVNAVHINNEGKTHYFEKHILENMFHNGPLFFEILHKGNVRFLKLHEVQLQNANVTGKTENRVYLKNEKYFFLGKNQKLFQTRLGKRHLLRVIPKAKRSNAREIIRQHDLAIKTGEQMAEAIKIIEKSEIPFDFTGRKK